MKDIKKCEICGAGENEEVEVKPGLFYTGLSVHHKIPISKGGTNSTENLIKICEKCHRSEHSKNGKLNYSKYPIINNQISYTTIKHKVRVKFKISMEDYCIADTIYHLANNPENKMGGWCYASKQYIANFISLGERTVFRSMKNLLDKGLIEKNPITKNLKTTALWYKNAILNEISDDMPIRQSEYAPKADKNYDNLAYNNHTLNNTINNKERNGFFSLRSIKEMPDIKIKEIADKYKISITCVKNRVEDLIDYCEAKGKKYSNYEAALRNFIKIHIRKYPDEIITPVWKPTEFKLSKEDKERRSQILKGMSMPKVSEEY